MLHEPEKLTVTALAHFAAWYAATYAVDPFDVVPEPPGDAGVAAELPPPPPHAVHAIAANAAIAADPYMLVERKRESVFMSRGCTGRSHRSL